MARVTSVTLETEQETFVNRQIESGRYRSPDEVVNAALRLLEDAEGKAAVLKAALQAGERSGPAAPFDFEAFLAQKRATR